MSSGNDRAAWEVEANPASRTGNVFWKSYSLTSVERPQTARSDRPLPLWASVLIIVAVSALGWWLIAKLVFWLLTL